MNRALCAALLALLATGHASASFYIDQEAPQQLAVAVKPSGTTKQVFDLTFSAKRSWMAPTVRRTLAERTAVLSSADEINIVAPSAAPNNSKLAQGRIESIRQWLLENGITRARITTSEDAEPRPRDLADVVTITVSMRATPVFPAVAASRASTATLVRAVQPAPVYAAPVQPPQPGQLDDKAKLALLQRIISMGKNKIVKAEDALNIMGEIMAMQDLNAAAPPAAALVTAAPPTLATLLAADIPRQWTLDPSKSLRNNLDDWTRIAGYEPVNWQSSHQFTVNGATLTGTFTQVITELATAVQPLDFGLSKSRRTLTITDAQ